MPEPPRGLTAVYDSLVVADHRLARPFIVAMVVGWASLLAAYGAQAGPAAHAAGSRSVAAQYMVIAKAGNSRLEDDFDPLEGRDRNHVAAARADLRDAAATERLFDRRLLRIRFKPATERVARHLYRINQARANLTAAVAASATSLRSLHAYEPMLDAANVPVEQAVRTIRRQLGLPPPSTS